MKSDTFGWTIISNLRLETVSSRINTSYVFKSFFVYLIASPSFKRGPWNIEFDGGVESNTDSVTWVDVALSGCVENIPSPTCVDVLDRSG